MNVELIVADSELVFYSAFGIPFILEEQGTVWYVVYLPHRFKRRATVEETVMWAYVQQQNERKLPCPSTSPH